MTTTIIGIKYISSLGVLEANKTHLSNSVSLWMN